MQSLLGSRRFASLEIGLGEILSAPVGPLDVGCGAPVAGYGEAQIGVVGMIGVVVEGVTKGKAPAVGTAEVDRREFYHAKRGKGGQHKARNPLWRVIDMLATPGL